MNATIVTLQDFMDDPETIVMHVHATGVPAFITQYGRFIARIDPVDAEVDPELDPGQQPRQLQDARRYLSRSIRWWMLDGLRRKGKVYSVSVMNSPPEVCHIVDKPVTHEVD